MSEGTPFVAKIGGKGKVTIPKNVRELHGLQGGDIVICAFVRKASVPVDRDEDVPPVEVVVPPVHEKGEGA